MALVVHKKSIPVKTQANVEFMCRNTSDILEAEDAMWDDKAQFRGAVLLRVIC